MNKLKKIYAGFYGYGEFSIQKKFGYWYIFDKNNKLIKTSNTLKEAVLLLDIWVDSF